MSVNKVILVGRLGKDPEVRSFPQGGQVCNVSLATTEKWRDRQTNEMRETTEWHNLVFNEKLAEVAGKYLRKGSQIYVEGSIRTRKWQDKNTGQDRYTTEIRVQNMQMLGSRQGDGSAEMQGQNYGQDPYQQAPSYQAAPPSYQSQQAPASRAPAPAPAYSAQDDFTDDDVPF